LTFKSLCFAISESLWFCFILHHRCTGTILLCYPYSNSPHHLNKSIFFDGAGTRKVEQCRITAHFSGILNCRDSHCRYFIFCSSHCSILRKRQIRQVSNFTLSVLFTLSLRRTLPMKVVTMVGIIRFKPISLAFLILAKIQDSILCSFF